MVNTLNTAPNPYQKDRKDVWHLNKTGRKVIAGVIAAAGVVGFGLGRSTAENRPSNPEPMVTYTAQPGDTVWGIADNLHGEGEIRPLVDQLQSEVNGLHKNGTLQPGDNLQIPVSQVHNQEFLHREG